jgi:cytochrome c oxidase subunit 2
MNRTWHQTPLFSAMEAEPGRQERAMRPTKQTPLRENRPAGELSPMRKPNNRSWALVILGVVPGLIGPGLRAITCGSALVLVSGCEGMQSAFSPFGTEAESTLRITWAMILAASLITVAVLSLAAYAVRSRTPRIDHRRGMQIILWLGAIGPTLLLTALLVYSLPTMRPLVANPAALRIAVDGEQFWWRVRYQSSSSAPVETANEVRLPVGRTVVLQLTSSDVIHSFWIPGLAGKMDMIPGRTNELIVRATRAGLFRGACTEFCGLAHARMAFDVVAMEPGAFDAWLADLARPARDATGPGRERFGGYGCAGCHVVRGHAPGSAIGPDLTHFGARRSLAAGTLPMTVEAISAFIRDPAASKPGARMPSFAEMPVEDANAIAAYLVELR